MKNTLILTLFSSFLILGACTPTVAQRGNMIDNHQIEDIIAGVHTKSDALRILGSPTTMSAFDNNVWYYIGQETQKRGILDPEVTQERIVVATFNDEGILESLKESDQGRIDIPLVREKTPTHGKEVTFMQQMLGNLGRFNPQTPQ